MYIVVAYSVLFVTMESNIIKIPGTYEELSIICPKCGGNKVTICVHEKGYFEVYQCYKCGYKKEE